MLDKNTYKSLFDEYYEPLCQYAYSKLKDRMAAEDIVQDVYVYIWNKKVDFDEIENTKNYLMVAVRNKIYERIRKKKISLISVSELTQEDIVAVDNSAENLDEYILLDRLYKSIRQLPDRCSTIFALSKIEGKSNKQIANELNLSVKTIENQMTKAFKLLRANLKDLF